MLAEGRRSQLGLAEPKKADKSAVVVDRTTSWEVLPSAAFFLPILAANKGQVHRASYVLFCDVLLLLTVLDGSERVLDGLVRSGVSGTPLEDRWSWRSRIHLPREAWQSIERVLRWSDSPWEDATVFEGTLLASLAGWSSDDVSWEDFLPERIDIALSSDLDAEIVRTITLAGELEAPDLPRDLRVSTSSLSEELVVRVGQVLEWPRPREVITQFPKVPPITANTMIRQVHDVFSAPSSVRDNVRPDLVVLPELAIPQSEIRNLHRLVLRNSTAVVAGAVLEGAQAAVRTAERCHTLSGVLRERGRARCSRGSWPWTARCSHLPCSQTASCSYRKRIGACPVQECSGDDVADASWPAVVSMLPTA